MKPFFFAASLNSHVEFVQSRSRAPCPRSHSCSPLPPVLCVHCGREAARPILTSLACLTCALLCSACPDACCSTCKNKVRQTKYEKASATCQMVWPSYDKNWDLRKLEIHMCMHLLYHIFIYSGISTSHYPFYLFSPQKCTLFTSRSKSFGELRYFLLSDCRLANNAPI